MHSRAEATPGLVWVAELADPGARVTLDAEASRYVARVCRARVGEGVQLTDGTGGWAAARVLETHPRVMLEIERFERTPRTRHAILLCGAPEGERADWMVEKIAELGIAVFQPVDCERASWDRFAQRRERWERLALAALRQARARHRMELRPPLRLAEALEALPEACAGLLATPEGEAAAQVQAPRAGVVAGAVGPASGFDPTETASMTARGWGCIALADNRLRTETAAMAWAAWWAAQAPGGVAGREFCRNA